MTQRGIGVRCVGVSQIYDMDGDQVLALENVDVSIDAGDSVALFGPSGSGKSTLLSLIAGLQRQTSGQVMVGEQELGAMSERALLRLRSEQLGIVLQNPSRSLLPYGTAEENIRFAQRGIPRVRRGDLPSPIELLDALGLPDLARRTVGRLSGGEQQRVSIAIAMAALPGLVLADEPTSQLDEDNRDLAVAMLERVNQQFGTTLVVVTHDPIVADVMRRRVTISEGRIVDGAR